MNLDDFTLDTQQFIEIPAALGDVYKGVLHRFGDGNRAPNGESLQMVLEPWAGGRWFRDRGNGIGHLWGHVQVIKAPTLLELAGPMFMSYPALNHVEVRLEPVAGGTKVTLRHRALGFLDPSHKAGLLTGWRSYLDGLRSDFP